MSVSLTLSSRSWKSPQIGAWPLYIKYYNAVPASKQTSEPKPKAQLVSCDPRDPQTVCEDKRQDKQFREWHSATT